MYATVNVAKRLLPLRRQFAITALLLMACACAPLASASTSPVAAPSTPVPIRAVYLITGQGVLAPSDVQSHPEILVVHSFDELALHARSKLAIWIDKSATPFAQQSWLNAAPQAWYPLVLVGYHDTLYSFREVLGLCCFSGPIVDWNTVSIEPGFSVIQREDFGGPLPQATFLHGYDQAPTAGDILAITDALLAGRLQTTPRPDVLVGASPTPPPVFAGLTAQVELDAFSGRPNLTWPLSAAETETFRHRAAALSRTAEQTYPGRLGYRGMIIRLPDGSGGEVIWRVWDGFAQMTSGTTTAYYADPNDALQSWLLQSGQTHLPADQFEIVREIMSNYPQH